MPRKYLWIDPQARTVSYQEQIRFLGDSPEV
jgi:hypothetical protein